MIPLRHSCFFDTFWYNYGIYYKIVLRLITLESDGSVVPCTISLISSFILSNGMMNFRANMVPNEKRATFFYSKHTGCFEKRNPNFRFGYNRVQLRKKFIRTWGLFSKLEETNGKNTRKYSDVNVSKSYRY